MTSRHRALCVAVGFLLAACSTSSGGSTSGGEVGADAAQSVCPGWVAHRAPGGTLFALPRRVEARPAAMGTFFVAPMGTSFVDGSGSVYLELIEIVVPGFDSGSDLAAIEGFLAGIGDPAAAELQEGWSITAQRRTTFQGRTAAERVIEIQGQALRREVTVRAGPTFVQLITMSRLDTSEPSDIGCLEQSVVLVAPAQ